MEARHCEPDVFTAARGHQTTVLYEEVAVCRNVVDYRILIKVPSSHENNKEEDSPRGADRHHASSGFSTKRTVSLFALLSSLSWRMLKRLRYFPYFENNVSFYKFKFQYDAI